MTNEFNYTNPPMSDTARNYNREKKEKRELRRLGNIAGLGLVLFLLLQLLGGLILGVTGLVDEYFNDPNLTYAIGTFIAIFTLGGAFFISWLLLKDKKKVCLNFGKPYDTKLMLYAVPAGLLLCIVGNFATFYFSEFFEKFLGIVFESPEIKMPTSPMGIVGFLLQIAFVPALVEEFAMRGVVMMPLRKYGNLFAIVMSAALFGIMHGNLVQAPFAFIVGIGIGYLVIITGSMWTGVLIHFLNNLYSGVISLLYEFIPETQVNIVYYTILASIFVFGIACTLLFIRRAGDCHISTRLKKNTTILQTGEKVGAYMLNIPMILAVIYLIYQTSKFVSLI